MQVGRGIENSLQVFRAIPGAEDKGQSVDEVRITIMKLGKVEKAVFVP